jgi:integrase
LARTGLRIGEAVALRWEDINFNGRFIKVERTYYKGRIGRTKNGKPRTVDMSWQLKDALLNLKQGRVVVDINEQDQWVFTDRKGGLLDVDKM